LWIWGAKISTYIKKREVETETVGKGRKDMGRDSLLLVKKRKSADF
jgi:hypothetical protein